MIYIEKLGLSKDIEIVSKIDEELVNSNKVVTVVSSSSNMYVPLLDLVDINKELDRLSKEKDKLDKEIERLNKKLSNQGFVSKAPEKVIKEEKDKLRKYESMVEEVDKSIANFKSKF